MTRAEWIQRALLMSGGSTSSREEVIEKIVKTADALEASKVALWDDKRDETLRASEREECACEVMHLYASEERSSMSAPEVLAALSRAAERIRARGMGKAKP